MELLDKLKELISEAASIDPESITEETNFKEDLGLDSLDLYEIVLACEDFLQREIDDDDLAGIETVGDALEAFAK